jgi:hypothetical protein
MDIWHSSPRCPQCGNIFSGANKLVNYATAVTAAAVTGTVAAGTIASLETVQVAVGYGETSGGSPLIHTAVGANGEWMSAWGEFGNMTMDFGSETWVQLHSWFQFSVPVLNSQAVLNTAGATVSTCVSGVCQAIWNGWVH